MNMKYRNNCLTIALSPYQKDMSQSLVVWAISEGRETARGVDHYLMGYSELPTKGNVDLPRV
jgi:NADPH-dependent glutamate synthase beta subunit-like oxidoreductase